MNMTSNCDVTKSAHPIQITTICHWMKPPWNFLGTPLISINIGFHSWWRMNRNVLGAWNDASRISARWQLYNKQAQYHMGYWNMISKQDTQMIISFKMFFQQSLSLFVRTLNLLAVELQTFPYFCSAVSVSNTEKHDLWSFQTVCFYTGMISA